MTGDEYLINIVAGWLICPACLRVRFSPLHGAVRLFGLCPGRHG